MWVVSVGLGRKMFGLFHTREKAEAFRDTQVLEGWATTSVREVYPPPVEEVENPDQSTIYDHINDIHDHIS